MFAAEQFERVAAARQQTTGETMKKLPLRVALTAVIAICALGFIASPAFSKQEGKLKPKGSEKSVTRTSSGREAGELPSGIERYSERKGNLPSGLQKKKDADGPLTHGLDAGGKKLDSTAKGKKVSKK